MPREQRRSVIIRLTDDIDARAHEIAAKAATLTTFNRVLSRAVEVGLEQVARELGLSPEIGRNEKAA